VQVGVLHKAISTRDASSAVPLRLVRWV